MEQDKAVNRVLRDLKQFDLISKTIEKEVRSGEARVFLNALYVAGLEEGLRRITANYKKTIILYNEKDVPVAEYESAAEAARVRKISVRSIYKAIFKKSISKNGYYWQYKEDKEKAWLTTPGSI